MILKEDNLCLRVLSYQIEVLRHANQLSFLGKLENRWEYLLIIPELIHERMVLFRQSEPNPANENWINCLRIIIILLKLDCLLLDVFEHFDYFVPSIVFEGLDIVDSEKNLEKHPSFIGEHISVGVFDWLQAGIFYWGGTCLNKDVHRLLNCWEVFDSHTDCLKGEFSDKLDAGVTSSDALDDRWEHEGLCQLVIFLHKAVHQVFDEISVHLQTKLRSRAIDEDVVGLIFRVYLRIFKIFYFLHQRIDYFSFSAAFDCVELFIYFLGP